MLVTSVYPTAKIGIRSQQLFYKVAGLEHTTKSAIWNDGVGGDGAIGDGVVFSEATKIGLVTLISKELIAGIFQLTLRGFLKRFFGSTHPKCS